MNRTSTRLWDFPSAAFLILALSTASQRLYNTHWAEGLGSAIVLSFLGAILGLAIGFSKFKRGGVFWLTMGYGIPIVILMLDWILYAGISWLERVANLSDRLAACLGLFFTRQPVQDTVLFVVFMALVFWIISMLAGYALTRFGNFIGAVLPAGLALVIIQLYDSAKGSSDALLAVYIFFCLLLLGRLTYVQRRSFWKEHQVSVLTESKSDLNILLAMVALATVVIVWLAPTSIKSLSNVKAAWENFTQPLRDVERDLGHAVAGLNASGNVQTMEFFGDALPLGRQAATGESVYLRIRTPLDIRANRYYWRVRSYNIFRNNQWLSGNVSSKPFKPDQEPIALADPAGQTYDFTFTVVSLDLLDLVTPARPVWVSYPSELFFLSVPQGKMDPIQFRSNPSVLAGERYTVRANVYEPTILQLRNAGEVYPDWVTSHYLQIPDNISSEIVDLAKRITENAKTPYDKAVAITNTLRSTITYSNTVEDPPPGWDPLDWFLFGSKKGFCNYYATAEVILLRSAGIPARMVVGFAQGEYVSPDLYLVRQQDTHAWPEVYFPGIGWVEFEPTASQTALPRQLVEGLSPGQAGERPPEASGEGGERDRNPPENVEVGIDLGSPVFLNRLVRFLLIFAIIVAILRINPFGVFTNFLDANQQAGPKPLPMLIKRFLEKRGLTPPGWLLRWGYLAELTPLERAFTTVYRSLHWLGEKPSPAQTPAEAAAALAERLPRVSKEIYALLYEYQRHLYSQMHGYRPFARRVLNTIRQEALRIALKQRWMKFRGILKPGSHSKT
jgi:transglutaminase-like putative cysteine protease